MKKIYFFTLFFFSFIVSSSVASDALIPSVKRFERKGAKLCTPSRTISKIDAKIGLPPEGYTLKISPRAIEIAAVDSAGLVWANRTLEQLYVDGRLPEVAITDYPSFPFRAFMHDTGRNFIELDMIKRHIEVMSAYKINVFHWHLSDNPAWRIQCKVYPQLNDAKFQRKGRDEGRYYTYDEIRDVIRYGRERGVMVVPEIDMPGHSQFFNATFGFSMDSEPGMAVLEKCLEEFFVEIPVEMCPYFHIGSDEVHIADPAGFMKWAEGFVAKHGRQAIAWDPGLQAAVTTIRQVWNEASGANSAAAQKEGRYLDSFMGYLNYYDPMVFTSRVFLHTPCGVAQPIEKSLGGILCLWNDVNVDDKSRIELHNGMINGMLPFAERFWNGGVVADTTEVKDLSVLPASDSRSGQKLAEFERKMAFHRDHYLRQHDMRWVANASIPFSIEVGGANVRAWGGSIDMVALMAVNDIKAADTMTAVATTTIISPCDTVIRAWVGFDAPARSNRIGVGIGEQGQWEAGGQVLVNGAQVLPPVKWNEPAKYAFNFNTWHKPEEELPYTDEQFYWMRQPAFIPLRKGENSIKILAPKTFAAQRWTFTFIPLTLHPDGRVSEPRGIKFK